MKEYTIIVIGKSGSGKGTQIQLLHDFLSSQGVGIYYLQSGKGLRKLSSQKSHTGTLLQNTLAQGKLVPTAIAIWSWVNNIIGDFSGQGVFFVDGAPRKLNEAMIMDEMFDFFDRTNRYVIHIDVSDEWCRDKLEHRGRSDDKNDSIESRLAWFRENSPEILSFFEKTGKYTMLKINGEQSIEDVQKEVRTAIGL